MAHRSVSKVSVAELGAEMRQTLTLYHEDINEAINQASEDTARELVQLTKATAPTGHRGSFKRKIAFKEVYKNRGVDRGSRTYVWYVKTPDYRLTHLIVHGHAKVNGGRTKANPFLRNAVDQVMPAYESRIKEALKNGGGK